MSIPNVNRLALALVICTLFLGGLSAVNAQSAVAGAVGGSVSDPSRAAVSNATITLQSVGTNKTESASADAEGRFRFNNLQPGVYTLSITASGFSEYKQTGIVVEVGRLSSVDAVLKIGAATDTVEIVSAPSAVNTESKEFTSNINQTQINELPINGRRWSNFAILTPGSVPDGSFGLISFRGVSGLLNNNTIDGGDNNQAFFGEERGRTRLSYSVSQSAIREFQVNTSNYSAEYGRAAGGVTNAVTKSGTNALHGDAFYYQRNNDWGARNPLAFQSVIVNGAPTTVGIKPDDVRHQFGGTIGGPIIKDKLFFFFSYDQQKRNFPGLGIFSQPNFLTTINRTALTGPGKGLTNAQIDSTAAFLNSLTGTVDRRGDQTLVLPKIDWQVTSKHTFTATYNRLRWDSPSGVQTQATNALGRASFGDDFVKVDWGTARLLSTLSPRIVNEFRYQYARDFEFQIGQAPLPGEPRTALNGSSPNVFLTNGLAFGKPTFLERPAYPKETRNQYTDNVTVSIGANTLKFGADFNRVKDVLSNLRNESGAYSYNNINDFIIDYVNFQTPLPTTTCVANPTRFAGRCYTSNYNQGFGPPASEFSTTDYNFYAQYDWKFLPRVTINLGLRYEYQALPEPYNVNASTVAIPGTGLTLNQATANLPADKNNFGPRVGFAVDLSGNGKTSLRGGYGLYYGRLINSTISNALVNTGGPNAQFQVTLAPTLATAPIYPNVLASAPAGASAVQFFPSNWGAPAIHQGDLIFEREIFRDTTVSASYLVSIGTKLPIFFDRNLSVPVGTQSFAVSGGPYNGQTVTVPLFPTARPVPAFAQMTEIASSVKSQYNALVLQANRRLSKGLQFMTSYTLSKSTDNGQTSQTFTANNTPLNVFDPGAEQALSNFDRRHKFVASVIFSPRVKASNAATRLLADGWTIAPVYQYYSGFLYDGVVSGSFGGAGGLNRSGGATRFPLLGRNAFTGPGAHNVDLRISRRFYIKEKFSAEILGEAFNILNRTQITGVTNTFYNLSGTTLNYNAAFGATNEAGGTLYRERQIQIGVRFQF